MVLIFLLSLFSVAQFTLSNALSSRDSAIDQLSRQIGDLANQLSIEKRAGRACRRIVEQLTLQLGQTARRARQARRRACGRAPLVGCAQGRTRPAHRAADLDAGRARQARRRASQSAAKESEAKAADLQKEIERQRLELTRLAASLAAANNEKGKLFTDLTEEQKLRPSRRRPWCA